MLLMQIVISFVKLLCSSLTSERPPIRHTRTDIGVQGIRAHKHAILWSVTNPSPLSCLRVVMKVIISWYVQADSILSVINYPGCCFAHGLYSCADCLKCSWREVSCILPVTRIVSYYRHLSYCYQMLSDCSSKIDFDTSVTRFNSKQNDLR